MRILVDTNILGRISEPHHQLHATAIGAVTTLRDAQHELRIVPQVIYEFWVVATRPERENGLGLSILDAAAKLAEFKAIFPPLRDERGILEPWEQLVVGYGVSGKPAHDARLVAAMERHELSHLLTFNTQDFKRYASIEVLSADLVGAE